MGWNTVDSDSGGTTEPKKLTSLTAENPRELGARDNLFDAIEELFSKKSLHLQLA